MDTRFKNTDFFIEDIDESVKDLTVNDSSVSHLPANTDFFIENIDNNVIEICTDRGITPATVSVVPANTDFFIVNIDSNVKKIATDLSITPSSVQKIPANTDFFIENIYFNVILICEELNIEPYEITNTPTNTDFFIEAIAKNVEKIMEAQTEIHVSGTFIHAVLSADSEISDYELDGNATQTTYTGKNLFDISKVLTNGTFVINNGNGTLTITTPSASSSVAATTPNKLSDYCPTLQAGDTATFSMTTTGTSKYIYLYGTGANVLWGDRTAKVITQDLLNASVLWYASGVSTTATILDIQVELGNTATAYEPYVGGTASPNPSYPQAINTVTGEQTVKVVGKNLFSTELEQGTIVGADGTHGAVQPERIRTKNKIYVEPTTTYTLNATTENTKDCFVFLYDKEGTFLERIPSIWSNLPVTFTTSASTNFVEFCLSNDNQSGNIAPSDLSNIQLELSSTATAYEPYQGQEFEVNLGKNLAPNNATSQTINQVVFTKNDDGSITANGTADSTAFYPVTDNFWLEAGTYTLSSTNQCTTTAYLQLIEVATGSPVLTNLNNTKSSSFTITNGKTARLYYRIASGAQVNLTVFPQLERGTLATSYAPYFTPIELAKVGTYQDRIYKSEGKWYIEKQVGKAIFNGSENWYFNNSGTNTNRFALSVASYGLANGAQGLCNNNEFVASGVSADAQVAGINSGVLYYRINKTTLASTSADDFKTWLASNNSIIYTALATPTTTEITDATLVGELNDIYALELKEGEVNISITATSPNLPASLKATIIPKE